MSEEVVTHDTEGVPTTGVADWAAMAHLSRVEEIVRSLTVGPWAAHPDPDGSGTYYISGPPETRVVAENLTAEDATAFVSLISALPEALEYFEDLARLWDVLNDGVLGNKPDDLQTYLEVIGKYQIHIAQLEGNPAPIPAVTTAGDLTFMHVGHFLRFKSGEEEINEPIVSVSQISEDFTRVRVGYSNDLLLFLPKAAAVTVDVVGVLAPPSEDEEISSTPSLAD